MVQSVEAKSAEERVARAELAALCRLFAHFRWTGVLDTHLTVRVPGTESFLANPPGALFEEVTPSSLVKLNTDGELPDTPRRAQVGQRLLAIHQTVYRRRPEVACVLFADTTAGVAVSANTEGLLPISLHAAAFIGRVFYNDPYGAAADPNALFSLADALGRSRVAILRNCGLMTAGRNTAEAFYLMNALQRACEIQVSALASTNPERLSDEAVSNSQAVIASMDGDYSRDWAAMRRLVERLSPNLNG